MNFKRAASQGNNQFVLYEHEAKSMASLREWESKIREWAEKKLKNHDASHDTVHASNVARICNLIMNEDPEFNGDAAVQEAILSIAWTHDICDQKYVSSNKEDVVCEICVQLDRLGLQPRALDIAKVVVGAISFSARLARVADGSETGEPPHLSGDCLLAYRVVSDADMLEAMGIVGIVRTFMYQAVMKHTSGSAFSHIQNRLLRCKDYLHFKWSIQEGNRRYVAMQTACTELLRERQPI